MQRAPQSAWRSIIPVLCLAGPLCGQGGDRLASIMAENAKLIRQYTFKVRTEVAYKGQPTAVRINQVRFGPDGKRGMALVSQSTDISAAARGLGKTEIAKKRDELKEYGDRVTELVEMYLPPDPVKLREALAKAELGASGNSLSLVMKNYLKPGDTVSIVADPASRKLQRFELKTNLDKDLITVISEMANLPNNGPIYPSVTKVKAPAKNLEINITEYDFMKL